MIGERLAKLGAIGLAILAIAAAQAAGAEPRRSLVFILDGSGSMWGRIEAGETKIEAAKSVTRDLLKDVPGTVEIGFVAYGHRRKGDCTDIETIAPLGSEPDRIGEAVQRIQPKGKTPITEALRHAVKLFESKDRPSTLLLVSDGIETCKGDPCALARELKKQGVKLVIHTVGFGVGDKAARQLQCIAEAGGGNYYDARSHSALRAALFEVRKAVVEDKPAPKTGPLEAKPQPKSKTIRIAGPGTIKLKPASWVKFPPYQWHAADPESGEKDASAKSREELKVHAGEYQIVWRQSEHYSLDVPLTEIVQVPAGKTVEVRIDTGLQIVAPKSIRPPYYWSLARPGDDKPFARFRGTLDPQVVPAGEYRLVWKQSEHDTPPVDFGVVTIEGGKLNRQVLNSGIEIRRADWIAKAPYLVELVKSDGKSLGQWRHADGVHLVPEGKYSVRYRQTEHYHGTIELGHVTVPKAGMADVTINSGAKFVPQPGARPPYKAIFVHLDSGKEFEWRGKGTGWQPVPLPPGRYKLDWWEDEHATKRMTLLDEFEIETGTLVELQM